MTGMVVPMRSALEILDFNNTQTFIVPSAEQYPHQWLWDACFHAIILASLRPELAARELDSLLSSQRPDGMIPHVTFNPYVDGTRYRPNATDWDTGGPHSGITQTPLIAPAVKRVFQLTEDRMFLRRAYPRIARYHAWLKKVRDPDDTGLTAIVHPWESGMDNSPAYDGLKETILKTLPSDFVPPPRADTKRVPHWQRPSDDYYRFYWGLIALFRACRWDQRRMMRRSPFLVADVLFNSVWCKANADLAQLAGLLGKTADQKRFLAWSDQTSRALKRDCWDRTSGFFLAQDLRGGRPIETRTIAGFMPLYAGAATPAMGDALIEHLMDRRAFYYHLGVPSASFQTTDFDRHRYWRGPVWINMHWLLSQGLRQYGYFDIASKLVEKSRRLVATEGYWEYYDPFTGKGLGASYFSWSTLTDIMIPLEPPAAFQEDVLVISEADAAIHPELKTLYLSPASETVELSPDRITSGPPIFTRDVLDTVRQRALQALTPVQESNFDRRLRQVADITKRLVQDRRGAWQDYPRICDLVSLAAHQVFSSLGYHSRVVWTRDIHYSLRIRSPKGRRWIVDLSPAQFGSHPVSRIPLLLERLTLEADRVLNRKQPPPLSLEWLIEETEFAVYRAWIALERDRLDRHEREALLYMTRRHQRAMKHLLPHLDRCGQSVIRQYLTRLGPLLRSIARRRGTA
jgi:hypothetical protein